MNLAGSGSINTACWFCGLLNTDCFSMEWDTYVHDVCAQQQAKQGNPEALIMLREWGELTPELLAMLKEQDDYPDPE